MIVLLNLLMVAIAVAGIVLNARGKWQGFILWLGSNAWWCGYNIWFGKYIEAIMFAIFWGSSLYGIFHWRGRRKKQYISALKMAEQREQKEKNRREIDNKQLLLLLEENIYLRNVINGVPYHKKAKKRLRINVPTAGKKG